MRLAVDIVGDIREQMRREEEAGRRATLGAMRTAGTTLKERWRAQVVGAGLGTRLARSIRAQVFPSHPSMRAAALVWTNAPEIIGAHERGVVIRSESGFWLAIPTEAAGRGRRGARLTPGEWERQRGIPLRFVYRRGQPSLLVAESRISSRGTAVASRSKTGRGRMTVPIFIMVPQVKLPKRLSLYAAALREADTLPGGVVGGWRESWE